MSGPGARTQAIFYAIGGFSVFSLGDATFKHLTATLSVPAVCAYAALIGGLYLFAFSFVQGGPSAHFRTSHIKTHILRGLVVFAHATLAIAAFSALPMATVYAMLFLAPFMIALLAIRFLGEHASASHWIAIAAGFLGILIVLRPGFVPFSLPVAAGLGAAVLFAISWTIVRKIRAGNDSALCFSFYVQIMIMAGSFGLMLLRGPEWPDLTEWGFLLLAGAATAGGNVLLAKAYLLAPSATVAPFHYVQMLWAIGLGALLFGDLPDVWVLCGGGVIIAAGLFLIRIESRSGQL